MSGCSLFLKKEKITISDTFCTKYSEFPNDEESKKHLLKSPPKMFDWVKVNETTHVCDCKPTPEIRKQCWQRFKDLNKK